MVRAHATEDVFRVAAETDRFWCAREVRRFARDLGFGERAQWELAIVAAELVSNAVRYGADGDAHAAGDARGAGGHGDRGRRPRRRRLAGVGRGARRGRAGASGLGLRTVRCLSHEVSIEHAPDGGTVVTAARYLSP